jgi:hypothetical protein
MTKWLIEKAEALRTPIAVVFIVSVIAVALLMGAPAAAAVGVKALALIFIIVFAAFIREAYLWLFRG